jgi:N-acetylglucosaminyl-diphospho-decaprenol L-rhamnosyltransferase
VALIRLDEHRGLAYAMNRGAEAGSAPYLLFLNNDIVAADGAVARLCDALRAEPGGVSAGGRLVDPGTTRTQQSYLPRDLPGLAGLLVRLTGIERWWPRNPWTGSYLTAPLAEAGPQRTARQPAGACLLVRRSAFATIGGWDERYSIWYEDVDISRRLLALGPAVYAPDAVFEHLGGASTGSWGKPEQHRRLYHGTLVYGQTHLPTGQQRLLGLVMIAVCLSRIALGLIRRDRSVLIYARLLRSALDVLILRPVSR